MGFLGHGACSSYFSSPVLSFGEVVIGSWLKSCVFTYVCVSRLVQNVGNREGEGADIKSPQMNWDGLESEETWFCIESQSLWEVGVVFSLLFCSLIYTIQLKM